MLSKSGFTIAVACLLFVGAAIFALTSSRNQATTAPAFAGLSQGRRQLRNQEPERPAIYTYWETPAKFNPKDDTMDLIENWRKAWYDMGWDPRVLSAQDAVNLPDYNPFMELLMLNSHDMISEKAVASYRRWLAMASVGGGWLADYTTFPLNYFLRHGRALPNDGQLTVYMGTNPVLLSGTAEEYYRVAKHIGETGQSMIERQMYLNENYPEQAKSKLTWSDKVALGELRKEGMKDVIKIKNEVMSNKAVEGNEDWGGTMNCEPSEGKRAVALMSIKPEQGETRGDFARKFVNKWRAQCQATEVAEDK